MSRTVSPEKINCVQAAFCRWRDCRDATRCAARADALAQYAPDETGHREMPLSRMAPGEYGHVLSLCPDCDVRAHLLELGFTPGTEITVVRVAPLGDPLTIRLRGYQLSLRRREADAILMRRCPPEFGEEADLDTDS
jgi:Fe2+ transport system protein FeoA